MPAGPAGGALASIIGRNWARSFSPSQTTDWLTCPRLWSLKRRWQARKPWTPYITLGKALHAGYAMWLANQKTEMTIQQRRDAAERAALELLEVECQPSEDWPYDVLKPLVKAGLWELAFGRGLAFGRAPLEYESVIAVEQPLSDGSIPDYVYNRMPGDRSSIGIADLKVKYKLGSEYVPQELSDTVHMWQMWHYAWRWYEDTGQPVTEIKKILLVLTPRCRLYTYDHHPTREQLERWGSMAYFKAWERMAEDKPMGQWVEPWALLGNSESCRGRYGRCDFYDACHVLNLDEARMEKLYDRIEDKA